jgi:polysaccharide pyruvyl transferase WcaK-like protein
MKKVILYNPSVSSLNMGDEIIFRGAYDELRSHISEAFVVNISTHLQASNMYLRYLKDADLKFVCGSNLLDSKLDARFRQWDITWLNMKLVGPCILMGVGWRQYQKDVSLYTKILYKNILAKNWIHSVRDSYTEKKLREIGFHNIINTACPTMWSLTPEHCSAISTKKASKVICTITDYSPDPEKDRMFFNILCRNYKEVYLWLQGYNDYSYFKSFMPNNQLTILPPSIDILDEKLSEDDIEYVGTRLHGGIRALQKKKRTTIIGIDNRALEKQKDFNLHVIKRSEIEKLEQMLNSEFTTAISVPHDAVREWKGQFTNLSEKGV